MEINKIIQGNCLEVLKSISDESVDMVFTDPPYNISSEIRISRGRNKMKFKGKDISLNFGDWDRFLSLDDYFSFTFLWVDECVRVLKPGRIFATWFDRDKINFVSYYLKNKYSFKNKGYFSHLKKNPVPQVRMVKWATGWEMIGLWQKPGGKLVYNYQLGHQPDYMIVPIVGGKERIKFNNTVHPTQKPLKIAELFIKYWTNENDLVLDPFCGVGTIPLAAYKNNRNYIGIEINSDYCKVAEKRIYDFSRQLKILL